MSMTKTDYELVAKTLKYDIESARYNAGVENRRKDLAEAFAQSLRALEGIAHHFALVFGQANPKFDRDRFLAACGVAE